MTHMHRVVYWGPRVRMGVHTGPVRRMMDPLTRRVDYAGPVVAAAARITALALGGHVVLSQAALHSLDQTHQSAGDGRPTVECLGAFDIPDIPPGACVLRLCVCRAVVTNGVST